MTPEERAAKVVKDIRDHELFNIITDDRWIRYVASAIEDAVTEAMPFSKGDEVLSRQIAIILQDFHSQKLSSSQATDGILALIDPWHTGVGYKPRALLSSLVLRARLLGAVGGSGT